MLEFIVRAAYTAFMGATQGPEVLLFRNLLAKQQSINQNTFETGADHEEGALVTQENHTELISFGKAT